MEHGVCVWHEDLAPRVLLELRREPPDDNAQVVELRREGGVVSGEETEHHAELRADLVVLSLEAEVPLGGTDCFSNATCLTRDHVFYVCLWCQGSPCFATLFVTFLFACAWHVSRDQRAPL